MKNIFKGRISNFFKQNKFDSLLLFNGDAQNSTDPNFSYFTGMRIDNSLALLTPDSATLYCSKMNLPEARETSWLDCEEAGEGLFERIRKRVKKGKIGVDFDSISASRYLRWKRRIGKLTDARKEIEQMRAVKDNGEIAVITKAVSIGKDIFETVEEHLTPKLTELEVSSMLAKEADKLGVTTSFEPIVAAGPASRFPHYKPQNRKIGKQMLLIDFGVRYKGYCSDNTRCFFLGECRKEKIAYGVMQDIFADIMERIPEFETGSDISDESIRLQKEYKMPDLPHSIGHGIGLEVHESPSLRKKSKDRIGAGNVIAIEPSAYFPKFGVRFEEEVLVLSGKRARVL